MRFRLVSTAAVAALAVSLLGAASASAATEFGDTCTANKPVSEPVTLFEISASNNPLPSAAPVSGVLTSFKVNLVSGAPVIPVNLKVLRQTGANTVQIIGEANGNIVGGTTSTINARIPVLAGDRLGFFSPSSFGAIICEEASGTGVVGGYEGSGGGPGSTVTFTSIPVTGVRIPLFATIEADADNDGFGDETQDLCPQSAATQAVCPPVTLSTFTQVKKGSAIVLVTPSATAPVSVFGIAKLGKGRKATLIGGTQTLTPGVQGRFTLKFTKGMKAKLSTLSRKRSLKLNVTVTGTSVSGAVTTTLLKLTIKGRAKP